jgi:uncharacterized cupredoxin-like copper-binding protein
MKRLIILCVTAILGAGAAVASGTHAGGHEGEMAVGEPGKASQAKRAIQVSMSETEDGKMIFHPPQIAVKTGETIRFVVKNSGSTDHEFVLDDHKGMMKHKALMEKFPEMEHADPNAVRLAPGEKGDVIWKFTKSGKFVFACLIPGHLEAGMSGPIVVK